MQRAPVDIGGNIIKLRIEYGAVRLRVGQVPDTERLLHVFDIAIAKRQVAPTDSVGQVGYQFRDSQLYFPWQVFGLVYKETAQIKAFGVGPEGIILRPSLRHCDQFFKG